MTISRTEVTPGVSERRGWVLVPGLVMKKGEDGVSFCLRAVWGVGRCMRLDVEVDGEMIEVGVWRIL